ncbi:hypothetical protein ACH5RR_039353 [Cinchona calisaya]|uniref:Uncharacterized protein n=1 Tax=Cinchona calisaya TaxID=153742 RepID=A0ABD2Y382_9GENT
MNGMELLHFSWSLCIGTKVAIQTAARTGLATRIVHRAAVFFSQTEKTDYMSNPSSSTIKVDAIPTSTVPFPTVLISSSSTSTYESVPSLPLVVDLSLLVEAASIVPPQPSLRHSQPPSQHPMLTYSRDGTRKARTFLDQGKRPLLRKGDRKWAMFQDVILPCGGLSGVYGRSDQSRVKEKFFFDLPLRKLCKLSGYPFASLFNSATSESWCLRNSASLAFRSLFRSSKLRGFGKIDRTSYSQGTFLEFNHRDASFLRMILLHKSIKTGRQAKARDSSMLGRGPRDLTLSESLASKLLDIEYTLEED